jgi:lipid-binding SYLF domain-containing protein
MLRLLSGITTALALGALLTLAQSSMASPAAADSRATLDVKSTEALDKLYAESTVAKDLGANAKGILIFPEITKGGIIVGGEYGEGVLRTGGKTTGYYSSVSGSIGLQLGISTRSLVIMFLTDEALKKFMESSGWEAGVDAQVAVIQSGATGSYDTISAQNPVVAFNFGEQGLMAGVSLEGTKVSKLKD